MKTCATCKHWGANQPGALVASGDAPYSSSFEEGRKFTDMKACGAVQHACVAPLDAMAVTLDASGYMAEFFTRAAFGCVLHEEKP